MTNTLKIILLSLIALVSVFIETSALAAGKHALLIGIQDYSKTAFDSLDGPANDIELTKGVLRERFGFQKKDFITLWDAEATHTGIEKAFQALIERVQPHDFVYIYYSGHGSQTADLNGDEPSGKDQTWVSYGARTSSEEHKDNYDVLDDEINAWLVALYDKTEKVVFVSDSCHSATITRGPAAPIRAVEDDNRLHFLGKYRYKRLKTRHGIRIGAARDNESAIDFPRENGKYYGLFTWYWTQNLQQAQEDDTWNDVFNRTYAQVTAFRGITQQPYMQQPQMAGKRELALGGGFTPLPPTIPVYPIHEGWVKILVGSLAGVTEGSVYRLYKPQQPNEQNLPRLTIKKVEDFESFGVPEPEGAFKTGDLVVEESHAYHFPSIKVFLEADFPAEEDKPLLQLIKSYFKHDSYGKQLIPAYTLADDLSEAELRLYLLRPKLENGQLIRTKANDALPKSFPDQSPELWVLTQEQRLFHKDLKIPFNDLEKGLELLQKNLKKIARVRELKALQSPRGSTLPVTVQTLILSPDKSCQKEVKNCVRFPEPYSSWGWHRQRGPYGLQDLDKSSRRPRKGDLLTFTLHNQSEQDYYCYLINLTPSGAIYSVFPGIWERMEYARINAGKTRTLMEEVVLPMRKAGKNTIKVITSTRPIDVSLLEQSPFKHGGFKGNLNSLEHLLVNAVHGLRRDSSIKNDEWATEQVTIEVK